MARHATASSIENMKGRQRIDLTGLKLGELTVIKFDHVEPKYQQVMWLCRCSCDNGALCTRSTWNLRHSQHPACGNRGAHPDIYVHCTHGHTRNGGPSATFALWARRKYDKRKILCARWLKFENFLQDVGEKPPSHYLARPNPKLQFAPGNAVWTTDFAMAVAKKPIVRIFANGQSLTIREWSAKTGFSMKVLEGRLRMGWDPLRIVTEPVSIRYTPPLSDITGRKFDFITALLAAGPKKTPWLRWKCSCDCGRSVIVAHSLLMLGNRKCCGLHCKMRTTPWETADWSKRDADIARVIGVTRERVRQAREQRRNGKTMPSKPGRKPACDWSAVDWTRKDAELAKSIHCSISAVIAHRRALPSQRAALVAAGDTAFL